MHLIATSGHLETRSDNLSRPRIYRRTTLCTFLKRALHACCPQGTVPLNVSRVRCGSSATPEDTVVMNHAKQSRKSQFEYSKWRCWQSQITYELVFRFFTKGSGNDADQSDPQQLSPKHSLCKRISKDHVNFFHIESGRHFLINFLERQVAIERVPPIFHKLFLVLLLWKKGKLLPCYISGIWP